MNGQLSLRKRRILCALRVAVQAETVFFPFKSLILAGRGFIQFSPQSDLLPSKQLALLWKLDMMVSQSQFSYNSLLLETKVSIMADLETCRETSRV